MLSINIIHIYRIVMGFKKHSLFLKTEYIVTYTIFKVLNKSNWSIKNIC